MKFEIIDNPTLACDNCRDTLANHILTFSNKAKTFRVVILCDMCLFEFSLIAKDYFDSKIHTLKES